LFVAGAALVSWILRLRNTGGFPGGALKRSDRAKDGQGKCRALYRPKGSDKAQYGLSACVTIQAVKRGAGIVCPFSTVPSGTGYFRHRGSRAKVFLYLSYRHTRGTMITGC